MTGLMRVIERVVGIVPVSSGIRADTCTFVFLDEVTIACEFEQTHECGQIGQILTVCALHEPDCRHFCQRNGRQNANQFFYFVSLLRCHEYKGYKAFFSF